MSTRASQADRVYESLRERLIRGELSVARRLVEQQIALDFGTSRTPVREALRRLEGDGHLTRDPSGGLRPRPPTVRAMRELYDVRLALEDLIVRRAAAGGDRGVLEALDQDWRVLALERQKVGWDAGDSVAAGASFVTRDEGFHVQLAEASGNRVATELLRDLNDRIRILRIHDFTSHERVAVTVAEHLEIVGAVLAGDADAASGFMRAHVQRSAAVVRERIGTVLARMFDDGEGPEPAEGADGEGPGASPNGAGPHGPGRPDRPR